MAAGALPNIPTTSPSPEALLVRGAREHNLRGFDLRIPRDQLVVITGPSGSGKSSLAFDTLYAEGQRRYVESLSAYARQFLEQLAKPDVESIDGLSPAVSIEQKTIGRSPRSTVGTATEIFDFLRLLFARVGEPHCHQCGKPIASQTLEEMVRRVLSLPEGSRIQVLAPVVRGRKGVYRKELDAFRRQGFVRVRIDGTMLDLSEPISLARQARHDIDLVIDRLVVKESAQGRLGESLATALRLADGMVKIDLLAQEGSGAEEWLLSRSSACVECGVSYPEMAPRMFSFNNPAGACPDCSGLGLREEFDSELVIPDESLSLAEGAIAPWRTGSNARYYAELLVSLSRHYEINPDTPWRRIPKKARNGILFGSKRGAIRFDFTHRGRKQSVERPWNGVMEELERRASENERAHRRLAAFRQSAACPGCEGARLRLEARHVRVGGHGIHELCALPVSELARALDEFGEAVKHPNSGSGNAIASQKRPVAERILAEIAERLRFLCDVGLGYLSLDRPSATLSGGEAQRIRLATQIGASLMGVLYILDEPSIGLHPRDHRRLLDSLENLRDQGNSVLVVEHDEETIRAADYVIDMGPGAGIHGGEVVATGSPQELAKNRSSLTGDYLSGRRRIPVPDRRRRPGKHRLCLRGCSHHNLQEIDLEIPLGLLTVVTGVSGSGKSTLINDTLQRALSRELHGAEARPGAYRELAGVEHIDKVIDVSQAPIGRTPRSNPATYSGTFDGIRKLFSQVPEARARGYQPGRFSFNVKGGRCEACEGAGSLKVEMHFLPDLFVGCEVCGGRRYNRETLEITYRGKNIADLLDMTVEEALELLENVPSLRRPLQALSEVGLHYIRLGQPATTLSGGEAQRLKLAKEFARRNTGRTLYLLDEPTTGLHFADVQKLLELLGRLVDMGNSVVVIEHQLDVIKTADFIIDIGPEGGAEGGRIVGTGTPEQIARRPASHTGRALKRVLSSAAVS